MTVEFGPATAADLAQVFETPLPFRVMARAAKVDGRLLGVGGITYMPGDTVAAFVKLTEEGRAYPVSLHKAGTRFMDELKRAGFQKVVALAEPGNPAAERWLLRLGFKQVDVGGTTAYVWER